MLYDAAAVRFALIALLVALPACSGAGDVRRFALTGVVVGHDGAASRVIVEHEAIASLMPAMTMPFELAAASPPVRQGDRITATLVVSATRSWLEDVKITSAAAAAAPGTSTSSRATPGAPVPAFQLVDQDGRTFTTADLGGRVLVITFIYTRCPLPDFCPLMVRHLERIRRRATDEGIGSRVALLGITLDPAFDTPPVLRAYGESALAGANRFEQWTLATGTAEQIGAVVRFFGVDSRSGDGLVTHTLATAVVTHDGRVMRTFPSNSWRPDEVLDVVRRGAERAAGAAR